jgi:translation initiation factor 2 beta subunit (eIF-2beta)/eIF-5
MNPINIDYDIKALVDRFYTKLNQEKEDEKNIKGIKEPDIMTKDRKTFINNFEEVCTSLSREPNTVSSYIAKELVIDTSISSNGMLIINKTYKKKKIMDLIKKYIINCVQCPVCKACDTNIIKVTRINFMDCNKCRARTAI